MANKEYSNALSTLQTLIVQEEGANQLLSMIMKIKCQLELNDHDNATATCLEMASTMTQINVQNESANKKIINQADDELKQLVQSFIKVESEKGALLLQHCRFDLVKSFYAEEAKLDKLASIGMEMQDMTTEMKKQNLWDEFKEEYPFMDSVLKELHQTNDVDGKFKCEKVAWFLICYANCCRSTFNNQKKSNCTWRQFF